MTVDHPLSLFDMSGKSALVIGATGTLGRAGATALAQSGCRMTIADASEEALSALAEELTERGAETASMAAWPDSEAQASAIVEKAVDAHGRLDVLFIALGCNDVALIEDQPFQKMREVMTANLDLYWLACQAAGRQFARQPDGPHRNKIVVVSSTRGRHGLASGYSAYCASKSGLDGMVRALAAEWGTKNTNINAIGPTVFRSPVTEWMFAEDETAAGVRESMLSRIPIGRLGEADDLIGGLVFLLSPASDYLTGQTLYIDGGYTAN